MTGRQHAFGKKLKNCSLTNAHRFVTMRQSLSAYPVRADRHAGRLSRGKITDSIGDNGQTPAIPTE
jgi:hypothetical protein